MIKDDLKAQSILNKLNDQLYFSHYDTTIFSQKYIAECFGDYLISKEYSKDQVNNIICLMAKYTQDIMIDH